MNRRFLGSPARRGGSLALALLLGLGIGGCDGLLDVENPNNIQQEDLEDPTSVTAAINGAHGTVTRGLIAMAGPYSTITDEITWIGSRDAWQQLDQGFIADPYNEFSDGAFSFIAQGRWMADEAIRLARPFYDEGSLPDASDMGRAYIYAAVAYMTIADQFDSFTLSDRMQAAPAIDPANMDSLYHVAIDYLSEAIAVAGAAGDADHEIAARALRARAYQALEIWEALNPAGSVATPVFVSSAEAEADAEAVLAAVDPGWEYQLAPGTRNVAVPGEVGLAYNVNQRQELQLGPTYVNISAEDNTELEETDPIALHDPITGADDPILVDRIAAFYIPNDVLIPYTVASAEEMHLILAENALVANQMLDFATHINAIRSAYGLPDWTPVSGVSAEEILMHERQVVLYLQGRRLADLYRFGIDALEWQASSPAASEPGSFFPITITEIRSNCHLNPDAPC